MIIKVHIGYHSYEIDCDTGTQDIAWLAISACYLHGINSYPVSRYIPTLAQNMEGKILHPKLIIFKNEKDIGTDIKVKIRNLETDLNETTEEDIKWYNQAFKNERFMMNVTIRLSLSNDIRGKDFIYKLGIRYRINQSILSWFPNYEKETEIIVHFDATKESILTSNLCLPHGSLEVSKIIYGTEDSMKETIGTGKSSVDFKKFPDPLTQEEKEELIKKKEMKIKEKEGYLRTSIIKVEEKKVNEEEKLRKLEDFLNCLPYSLDEIYEYTKKEILDSEKDLIIIFAILEQEDFKIFRRLYEIFNDYCFYYENDENFYDDPFIEFEAFMHFFRTYFDNKKNDMNSLISDFQKYHNDRLNETSFYNFQDFIYTIINLLYNLQIYKNISIEHELNNMFFVHEIKLQDIPFFSLFRDEMVVMILNRNIEYIKKIFFKNSSSKFHEYHEMSAQQYLTLAKEIATKNNIDFFTLTKNLKFVDGKGLFDFLECMIHMSLNIDDSDLDVSAKVTNLIDMMRLNITDF